MGWGKGGISYFWCSYLPVSVLELVSELKSLAPRAKQKWTPKCIGGKPWSQALPLSSGGPKQPVDCSQQLSSLFPLQSSQYPPIICCSSSSSSLFCVLFSLVSLRGLCGPVTVGHSDPGHSGGEDSHSPWTLMNHSSNESTLRGSLSPTQSPFLPLYLKSRSTMRTLA